MIVIGIDVGGTNTKIVGLRDGVPMEPIHVRATDPITSVFGALGKYISLHQLTLQDISKVMVTGVGSSFLHENIFNIPTEKVEEFHAVGRGGQNFGEYRRNSPSGTDSRRCRTIRQSVHCAGDRRPAYSARLRDCPIGFRVVLSETDFLIPSVTS